MWNGYWQHGPLVHFLNQTFVWIQQIKSPSVCPNRKHCKINGEIRPVQSEFRSVGPAWHPEFGNDRTLSVYRVRGSIYAVRLGGPSDGHFERPGFAARLRTEISLEGIVDRYCRVRSDHPRLSPRILRDRSYILDMPMSSEHLS